MTLKVLTWNVFLMMVPAKCPGKKQRTELIAQKLLDSSRHFDIVCLQKVFDRGRGRKLEKLLRGRFECIAWDNDCPVGFTSGLFVASKIPLKLRASLNFKDATGFERFAPKGAMIFDGALKGQRFQLVNTHLQGHPNKETEGNVEKSDAARRKQIDELAAFVRAHRSGRNVVQIVAGDFFVDKYSGDGRRTADYRLIEKKLKTYNGDTDLKLLKADGTLGRDFNVTSDPPAYNDFGRGFAGERTIKDYVFVLDGGKGRVRNQSRAVMRFPQKWSHGRKTYGFLSYRYAVRATIRFG